MKSSIFTLIICFFYTSIYAQDYDFGDVSKAELQEKYHKTDSSANAAILYRNEEISFAFSNNVGFIQERRVHMRVKIYTKDGFDWANEKVNLYKGNPDYGEKIRGITGYTYNLIDGKINKDKLRKSAVFEEDASEFYKVTSFIMPNVKEGSVVEYEYTVSTESPFIDDVNLQFEIPLNKLDVKIATPQYYSYNRFLNPRAAFVPQITESKDNRRITSTNRTRVQTRGRFGTSNSSKYDMSSTNYNDIVISINEKDIPALKAESFAGNLNNFKAKLSMELAALLDNNNIVSKAFTRTWDQVSKSIYDNDDFGAQLNKRSFFKKEVEELLMGVEDDFEKVFLIEKLVKSKVKWNGVYGKYAQNGVRSTYKEGEGNVADINLLLTAMLKSQGLNANPVLVSTRDNGLPLFPTREGFNYVICLVQSGDNYMLIDATEPFSSNNVLPRRVLNWKGRVLEDNGSSRWIDLKASKKSAESTMLNATIAENLSVNGAVKQNITSHLALDYRKEYTGVSAENHLKFLESNKGDLVISELKYENDKDITQPVRLSYNYELNDGVEEIGENLYFNPMFFMGIKESPFKLAERSYPIEFVIPFKDRYIINIAMPDGYEVESLPEPLAMEFKGGESKFTYIAKQNGKYLQISVELDINNPMVQPIDYNDFKEFFERTVEKQKEQIVLTKA